MEIGNCELCGQKMIKVYGELSCKTPKCKNNGVALNSKGKAR